MLKFTSVSQCNTLRNIMNINEYFDTLYMAPCHSTKTPSK